MNKKLSELRNMGESERMIKLKDLKNELAREKATKSTNTRPENPGKAKGLRKQVARILTINAENKKKVPVKKTKVENKQAKKGEVKQ
jgi:ribosomal protein L29